MCKIKQAIFQSLIDFVKVWKKFINRVTTTKQDLRETFASSLYPMLKLEVLDHDDISLGNMVDKFLKKEPCILQNYKELHKVNNAKVNNYTIPKKLATIVSVDKKSFPPK